MSSDQSNLNAIIAAAQQLTSAEERGHFLDRACGGNHALRLRIEALLDEPHDVSPGAPPAAPPKVATPPPRVVNQPVAGGPAATSPPPIVVSQPKPRKPRPQPVPSATSKFAKSPALVLTAIGTGAACLLIVTFFWLSSRRQATRSPARPTVAQREPSRATTQAANRQPQARTSPAAQPQALPTQPLQPQGSVSGTVESVSSQGTTVRRTGGGISITRGVTGMEQSPGVSGAVNRVGTGRVSTAPSPEPSKSLGDRALSKLVGTAAKVRDAAAVSNIQMRRDKASVPREDHVGLRYFPGDFDTVFHIRVSQLRASPLFQAGWTSPVGKLLADQINELAVATSVGLDDIEFLTVGSLRLSSDLRPFLYVIRTKSSQDLAALLSTAGSVQRGTAAGRQYARFGDGFAVAMVDSKTILFGTETDLRYGLGRLAITTPKSPYNWIEMEKYAVVNAHAFPEVIPECETFELQPEQVTIRYKNFRASRIVATSHAKAVDAALKESGLSKPVGRLATNLKAFKAIDDMELRGESSGFVAEEVAVLKGLRTPAQSHEIFNFIYQRVLNFVIPKKQVGPIITLAQFVEHYELKQTPRADEMNPVDIPVDPFAWATPQQIPAVVAIIKYSRNALLQGKAQRALCRIHAPETITALVDIAATMPLVARPKTEMLEHFLRYGDAATAAATCRLLGLTAADEEARQLLQAMADNPPSDTVRVAAQQALSKLRTSPPQPLVDHAVAANSTNFKLDRLKDSIRRLLSRRSRRGEDNKTRAKEVVESSKDGWDRLLKFDLRADGSFSIVSSGQDGRFGTADDLLQTGQVVEE